MVANKTHREKIYMKVIQEYCVLIHTNPESNTYKTATVQPLNSSLTNNSN